MVLRVRKTSAPPMGAHLQDEELEDVTKFWRIEKEDGAVYSTYLKKVTYHTISELENELGHKFSHLMWETEKMRVIRAGNVEKLIENLANEKGELESTLVNVFLATYRTFATTRQVLDLILERYKQLRSSNKDEKTELSEIQQRTMKSVILVWLDTYPEDFQEHPDYTCLHTIEQFAQTYVPESDMAVRAKHKIEKFKKEATAVKDPDLNYFFGATEELGTPMSIGFFDISNQIIAEQLTYRDAELFLKVAPHHCLGSVWSRRDTQGRKVAKSVAATVEQFNRVSLRVIATVLSNVDLKTSHRAKVLAKWINIAQELRELKNFSSLKAIISGLQAHAVYRLRKTWSSLSKEVSLVFESLSNIFSEENNQIASRELLMREATAKFPDIESSNRTLRKRKQEKRQSWIDNGVVQGTVPYLGTFLTDLTMIDTAIPDTTNEGLINIDKKRKEFEVIVQIKLLQSAAHIYRFNRDARFWTWFDAIHVLDETESHEKSCIIERPSEGNMKIKKKSASLGHRPLKWENSRLNVGMFVCGQEDRNSVGGSDSPSSAGPRISHSSSASSLLSYDSDTCPSPYRSQDSCVIKVSLGRGNSYNTHVYKSIMLTNTDHTSTVVKKVLEKYSLSGSPDDYCLSQILPDGELLIPKKSNVFYAMNNLWELNFVLRSKPEQETLTLRKKTKRRIKKLSL